ncbi:MAG: cupin domain-containing protein [Gammaproteobacteria bacterium]|nr:cupin domain-containing protein [Gammaproteobacteria bacterium]
MNNIFDAIPEILGTEVFEQLTGSEDVRIERIISKGHTSPDSGWHDQNKNEWVIILQGSAILSFENESSIKMQTGDFINIAAHKKHKVEWTEPDTETIWLAVHY